MYRQYWSLGRSPFENTPDPEFLYLSPTHREALDWLTYGIVGRKGAVVLTGDVGCGKTVISRKVIQDLPNHEYEIAVVVNPSLSPVELLREILYQLGLAAVPQAKVDLLHLLNSTLIAHHQASKHTVIVIDEAQAIKDAATLEELRLLLNFQLNDTYLLTLVLIGQPEWAERLSELPQLKQRVSVSYNLVPLQAQETEAYIVHRVRTAGAQANPFTPEAARIVHVSTRGTPRRINTLCDRCLMVGYQSRASVIDEGLVRRLAAQE